MQLSWPFIERHFKAVLVVPFLAAIGLLFLTGRTVFLGIGVVWFLGLLAVQTGTEAFQSVGESWQRRKRDALASFLQFGGYSIAAGSIALYFAIAYWTSYRPQWLVRLMFGGVLMFLSSGFVHVARRKRSGQKNDES